MSEETLNTNTSSASTPEMLPDPPKEIKVSDEATEQLPPGTEITVPPQTISMDGTANIVVEKPISAEPPKKMSEEEIREKIKEDFKKRYLQKYDLEGIDLEKELEKIKKKESHLSRSRRDAVVAFFAIFPIEPKKTEEETKSETSEVKEEASDEHNA